MASIWLPSGLVITSLSVKNGGTAEAGGTHAWAALFDSSRALLRQSNDETGAAAIAASVVHSFILTSTFTTTYSGIHYVGVCVVATTMPTLLGHPSTAAGVNDIAPVVGGNSTTGLTDTAPNPAAAITGQASNFYYYVS